VNEIQAAALLVAATLAGAALVLAAIVWRR
jgi:hypothetical protein